MTPVNAISQGLRRFSFGLAILVLGPMSLAAQTVECETWTIKCEDCVEQEDGTFSCETCTKTGEDCTVTPN